MIDASYFMFSHEEASRDGKNPWSLQSGFDAEINLDDMVATGNRFIRAAEQSREAEDLALRATQASQRAGRRGNQAIIDAEGRLAETSTVLPTTESEEAVDWIFRAINAAHRTEQEARRLIEPPELNTRHEQNQANAINEWNYWANQEGILDHYALAEKIRTRNLDVAAADAATTHDTLSGLITGYRQELAEIGDELGRRGYDPLSGPLDVFTTPEMARFSAEQLNAELAKDNRDPHIVQMYTRNLGVIENAVNADPHDDRVLVDPSGQLTPEGRYVQAFFDTISPEALGDLGRLDDSRPEYQTAKSDVANIINTYTNPDAGGINPKTAPVPESIRHFVYDYQNTALNERAVQPFAEELRRFNGFGELMSNATVAGGYDFSQDMARAAVEVQKKAAEQPQWAQPGAWSTVLGEESNSRVPFMPNHGSSGMLEAAALNPTASADLLKDQPFREGLLSQHWDSGIGAGELVRSGTIPPPDVVPNTPESQKYVDAAYGVLTYAGQHGDSIGGPDPAPLQRSIGNTALTYMDLISQQGGNTTDPPWQTPEGKERIINGKSFQYGFDLSSDDRQSLIRFMNGAEESVKNEFFTGVGHWQEQTAAQAFARDQANHVHGETATFKNIGTVQGAIAEVQGRGEAMDLSKGQVTAMTTISAVTGAASTLAEFTPAGAAVSAIGAYGINEGLRYALPDGDAQVAQAHADALVNGDVEARAAVANAAVALGYADTGRYADDPGRYALTTPGHDATSLSSWADTVVGQTGYLADMRDAYKTEQET